MDSEIVKFFPRPAHGTADWRVEILLNMSDSKTIETLDVLVLEAKLGDENVEDDEDFNPAKFDSYIHFKVSLASST